MSPQTAQASPGVPTFTFSVTPATPSAFSPVPTARISQRAQRRARASKISYLSYKAKAQILGFHESGWSMQMIANRFGVAKSTVFRVVKQGATPKKRGRPKLLINTPVRRSILHIQRLIR